MRRGRPRKFEPEAALEAAMFTFWEQGYHATSLDDLVARTGASRESLYRTFGDKRALFVAALELYGARFSARAEEALAREPSAREVVRTLLLASATRLTDPSAPPGCLRCAATLELTGVDAALDEVLAASNRHYEQVVQRVVDHGIRTQQMSSASASGLARYVTGAVNGMVTLALAGSSRDELFDYVGHVMRAWP